MSTLVLLLLGGVGLAAISFLTKKRQSRRLPRFTDKEFLSIYKESFSGVDELVLKQRGLIASHLGLPAERLSPNHRFETLSKYTGFVGEYEVAMGDLEDQLNELFERVGLERRASFPSSVGELIQEMIKAEESTAIRR